MPDLFDAAAAREGAVGAFNVILLEHAEALAEGAERAGRPIALQISQNCLRYHGAVKPIVSATIAVAEAAAVPVVVHLDHADDEELVREVVGLGVPSVMFDASTSPYDENVARTRSVSAWCHARGVAVEAEIGEVGGKDGVHASGARTKPDEAVAFAEATGVNSLAVAVGSSHAKLERDLSVDLDLIRTLRSTVPAPLVLHGSSSLDDDQLRLAVEAGMCKINISTHVNGEFTRGVRTALESRPRNTDPRKYIASGREALAAETARLVTLLG